MHALLLLALFALDACATVDEPSPPSSLAPDPARPKPSLRADAAPRDAPVDIRALPPPTSIKPPPPFATIEACSVELRLARHAGVTFEGDIVDELRDVELDVLGPPGLTVSANGGDFNGIELRPRVALRLPAGPAIDAPAGASGALFDLGGLVVAGFVNLLLLPVSVPIGLLTNGSLFVLDAPRFTDGMFSDVVLEKSLWQQEVERRAAPHAAALKREADRQARFAPVVQQLHTNAKAAPSCILDDAGRCHLAFAWPSRFVTFAVSGLPCAAPPAVSDPATPAATGDDDAQPPPPPTPAREVLGVLPVLPTAPAPALLPLPPPVDGHRGQGAARTSSRWASIWNVRMNDAGAVFDAARLRGTKDVALDDVDLVCRLKTRGNDFDIDGSAPELSIRLAWGFDHDVVGVTFGTTEGRSRNFGVHRATIQPGEAVKLSVVDIDAFVDDWVGMDIVVFDGRLPLRFSHPQFTAECRAAPTPTSSSSPPERREQGQQGQQGLEL